MTTTTAHVIVDDNNNDDDADADHDHHDDLNHLVPDYVDHYPNDDGGDNNHNNDDNDNGVFLSFPSIRRKTFDTIYNDANSTQKDKSPKASVDKRIRHLVDLINSHPSFATLSSCSGRISIYDPNKNVNFDPTTTTTSTSTSNSSGKGGTGGWLFVSHDPVADPNEVVEQILLPLNNDNGRRRRRQQQQQRQQPSVRRNYNDNDEDIIDNSSSSSSNSFISFQFEPMLLHVATCNVRRAKQLLGICLRLGFRESGIIMTPKSNNKTKKRATVAVRSYSLALNVPIFITNGDENDLNDCDSNNTTTNKTYIRNYLRQLTIESNRRLHINLQRIEKLYQEFRTAFFIETNTTKQQHELGSFWKIGTSRSVPDLNLWGHCTVVVDVVDIVTGKADGVEVRSEDGGNDNHNDTSSYNAESHVLVFGGYGQGPTVLSSSSSLTTTSPPLPSSPHCCCKRWDKIWRLVLRRRGSHSTLQQQSPFWEEVKPTTTPDTTTSNTEQAGGMGEVVVLKQLLDLQMTIKNEDFSIGERQGSAASILPSIIAAAPRPEKQNKNTTTTTTIAMFGGRTGGPTESHVTNDLLLCEYSYTAEETKTKMSIGTPTDIRGRTPQPRWGHTLTALSGSNSSGSSSGGGGDDNANDGGYVHYKLAVLIGGRNHDTLVDDSIYVLSLIVQQQQQDDGSAGSSSSSSYLLWESIILAHQQPTAFSRFYHTALRLHRGNDSDTSNNHIIVFGGLKDSPQDLLESFVPYGRGISSEDESERYISTDIAFVFDASENPREVSPISLFCSSSSTCSWNTKVLRSSLNRFGHAACFLNSTCTTSRSNNEDDRIYSDYYIAVSGGIHNTIGSDGGNNIQNNEVTTTPPPPLDVFKIRRDGSRWELSDVHCRDGEEEGDRGCVGGGKPQPIDFGSLVHHQCCCLPSTSSLDTNDATIVTTGGGVPGFSFSPIFAKSYNLSLDLSSSITSTGDVSETGSALLSNNYPAINNSSTKKKKPASNQNSHHLRPDLSSDDDGNQVANAVFVHKKAAKTLKQKLEVRSFLDKSRRMAPASAEAKAIDDNNDSILVKERVDPSEYIAVPITKECLAWLEAQQQHSKASAANSNGNDDGSWRDLIHCLGMQELPRSTATYASGCGGGGRRRGLD